MAFLFLVHDINSLIFIAVGLDAAGKTTILYKLKLGEIVTTIPTIGKFLFYDFCSCGKEQAYFSTIHYFRHKRVGDDCFSINHDFLCNIVG